ncbi:hypothetical protein Bca4012_075554 [Brassica carinata]
MHGANCASCKFHVGNSSDGNPPENGDDINDPSDSNETIPNREQEASIIENVDDVAQVSPEGNPFKKGRNAKIPASRSPMRD